VIFEDIKKNQNSWIKVINYIGKIIKKKN